MLDWGGKEYILYEFFFISNKDLQKLLELSTYYEANSDYYDIVLDSVEAIFDSMEIISGEKVY